MEQSRRRAQGVGTITAVLGVHLMIAWVLLARSRLPSQHIESQSLDMVFIARPPLAASAPPSPMPSKMAQQRNAAAKPSRSAPLAASSDTSNTVLAPIDWDAELARAARPEGDREPPQEPRAFGFPHAANAAPAKPPDFGWSHTATHRVESILGGGILINLSDNCVLVLFPLPFAGCAIGKKKANGDLFEHLHDASPVSSSKEAP